MTIISKRFNSFIHLPMLMMTLLLANCTTMKIHVSNETVVPSRASVAVGPIANHSDTPLANRQVESISLGLLQARGLRQIIAYPHQKSCEKLMYCPDESIPNAQLVSWARQHHINYVLTGSANEWRYKVGLDGEPVAGVSLMLVNAHTGNTVWTGVGSVIGTSRSGLDVVGQELLSTLLNHINVIQ